jgi:hypothetical protein
LVVIYDTGTGKEILDKVKFMYHNLPAWIRKVIPRKSKAERVSYIDFANGSKVFYLSPSSQRPADTIGRGLNISGVYIDEAAFLPLDKIIGSLSPAYRSAKQQAKKHKFPYYFIITTTPNGKMSYPGRVFYELYTHAIPIEELYDFKTEDWKEHPPEKLKWKLINDKNKPIEYNSYTKIKLHYMELPDTSWVEEEKRRIGYYTSPDGRRKWNQEYELLFLGSKDNIFPDDVIQQLEPVKPTQHIEILPNVTLKLWTDKFDPKNNWYIFGIDTAKSIDGDFSAIEIFDLKNFEQVGELKHRFGSVTEFVRAIIKTILTLMKEYNLGANFTLAIENVGIGNTTIEQLLSYPDYDFSYHILKTKLKSKKTLEYGIPTNATLKQEMIDILYQYVVENPKRIKSYELIEEMQLIERKNNKISAPPGYHDDLFMATAFSAYARYRLIKDPGQITNPSILEDLNPEYKARVKQLMQLSEELIQLSNFGKKDIPNNNSPIITYTGNDIHSIRKTILQNPHEDEEDSFNSEILDLILE